MSWLASLGPLVMAAGTGIASAIGNHIGNKAMQNTSNVAVQNVDTSTNAPALLENVAAVPDSYANQAMPPVNGVGATIKEQFTNTAQNLATEAGKKVINIGADLINNAIKKLSFKEIKRKGRDLYSLGKEAYHNFTGNKEGADEEQKIRFFNYIGDNFEDNLESLLGVSQGSEALKLTTKKNVMDYIKNLLEIRKLQEKEGVDSPTVMELLKKSDMQAGAAAIKNIVQMLGAQYGATSDQAPFYSGMINMLTKILNINNPYALAAITIAELAGTLKPVTRFIVNLFKKKDKTPKKKDTETSTKARYPYNDGTTPVYGYPNYDPYSYNSIYNMRQRQLEDLYRQGVYPEYLAQIKQPYWYHYTPPVTYDHTHYDRIRPVIEPLPLTNEPEVESTNTGPKVEELT